MKNFKTSYKNLSVITGFIIFSIFNIAWISVYKWNFDDLKNKTYYNTLFNESELLKLSEADDLYVKGNAEILNTEKYFRKADGFKKVAENYGGKTLKKAKRYEKKGIKSSIKAYNYYFKASDIKFHIYSEKLKDMNTDNSKKHLKAEEISINARSLFIEGSEQKAQADKLKDKAKADALKLAFNKHLEAIHNQDIAFGIYMNDPDIIYNEKTDEIKNLNETNSDTDENQNQPVVNDDDKKNNDAYNINNDPNIYESKEEFIIGKLDLSNEDLSALSDAKDKKTYADNIMNDVDKDYASIEKIRNEAENSDDEYEKSMKTKMAEGLEDVLFDKMLKAADLYFQADNSKYKIYEKYLPQARNSKKISEAKPYENNAVKLNADALKRYNKANFYSGHKSNKYIQIMDAVQTELSALQEQENAFSIYFDKKVEKIEPVKNAGKTNENDSPSELTYNYAGSYMYSKYNPKPVPLKTVNGIIFKVQVGLFKGLLPLKTYGKYSPISFDTFKNNPYRRFFIGEYQSYKAAEYTLKQIKRKGLTDPFIVAFENGKKQSATYGISKIVRDDAFEKIEAKEMSLLTGKKFESDKQNQNPDQYQNANNGITNITGTQGLIYCIQLGNFSGPKQASDFKGIRNLLTDKNAGFKYLSGPFKTYESAKSESKRLNSTSDYEGTFVTAYYNGKKISLQEAKNMKDSNNINTDKGNKENIYFAVQIAAYSHKLNNAEIQQFKTISDKYPITVKQVDGGLFLYIIGHYNTYKEAALIKKEIKELNYDGFVIAFRNNIKISASDAIEILKN